MSFFLAADLAPSSEADGCYQYKQRSNGNVADRGLLGQRFESWSADHGGTANDDGWPNGFEPPTCKPLVGCIMIRPLFVCSARFHSPYYLKPSELKLLSPPPKKSDI